MNSEPARESPMSRPLVSIVIPVFNGADFLSQAIDSALAQTWPSIEVIVVDDGSDDDGATRAVVGRYGDKIRLITKPNGGVATALNAGIAAMRGAWFSWLSHDDVYRPQKVERQMAALADAPDGSIAFGDYDLIDAHGTSIDTFDACGNFDPARPLWAVLEGRINGCTLLLPAAVLRAAGGFDSGLPTTQDYHLWFKLIRQHPLVPVPGALVSHRRHPNQGSRSERHLVEAGLLWAEMLERLTEEEMRALGGSELQFLNRLLRFVERTSYPLARAAVQARMTEHIAPTRVLLVSVPGAAARIGFAGAALRAAGMRDVSEIIIDDSGDAATASMLRGTAGPGARVFAVARHSLWPDAIEAALVSSDAAIIAFADAVTTLDPACWRRGLEAVAAGECDGWGLPAHAGDGALPSLLSGLLLSRAAYEAALVRHGDPGAALAALTIHREASGVQPAPSMRIHADPPPPARLRAFRVLSAVYRRLPWRPKRVADRVKRALGVPVFPEPTLASVAAHNAGSQAASSGPARLLVLHALGGGTLHYAELLGQHLQRHGIAPVYAWGVDDRRLLVSTVSPSEAERVFALPDELGKAVAWLRTQGIDRADVLHAMGLEEQIVPLLAALGCPYDVTFLDYHLIASTPHLMNSEARTAARGQIEETRDLAHLLRATPHPVVGGATNLLACSRDLAARLRRLAPALAVRAVRPPEPDRPEAFRVTPPQPLGDTETLRILQLGTTAAHKGRQTIIDVGRIAKARRLPIEIHVLGQCLPAVSPAEQAAGNAAWYGAFAAEDLPALIGTIRPHLAWFPAQAPETYGFALSEAMLLGLPIVAQGLGAYAERLAGRAFTWSLPADRIVSGEEWIDLFMTLRGSGFSAPLIQAGTGDLPPLDEDFYRHAYLR